MLKRIHQHLHRHYRTKYHGKYAHAKQLFIFDIFLLILAVTILISGVVFLLHKPVIKDDIELLITTNEPILKSGMPLQLHVEYTNTSKIILHPSTLALRLPKGFIVDRTKTPESVLNKDMTATITEPLAPGARGQVEISGQWWGTSEQPETLFATLSYFENQSTILDQKLISFQPQITSSILETKLTIPTSSFPNQPVPFSYSVQNNSNLPISGLSLLPSWEGESAITSSLKDITLAPYEKKSITGTLIAPSQADKYSFAIQSNIAIQDRTFKQTSDKEVVHVIYPAIVSEVRLSQPLPYIEENQIFPLEIHWKNESTFNLSNQKLRLHFTHTIIDLKTTALNNNIALEGNDLIITSAHRTALANGQPGAQDTFTLQIKTLPSFDLSGENVKLEIIPSIEAETLLVREQRFIREGIKIAIPVASNVRLTRHEVRYYTPEGDQIGRGVLPPKVGETTKYWILLQAANTTNELKDAQLYIQLAPGVTFSSSSQSVTLGSELYYDKKANIISWKYPTVPAYSKPGWNFMLEVTPNVEQVGGTLPLMSYGIFIATDTVGKKFEVKIPGVDNMLKSNDKGSRAGARVVK